MNFESLVLHSLPTRLSRAQLNVLLADLNVAVSASLSIRDGIDSLPKAPWLSPPQDLTNCHQRLVVLWRRLNAIGSATQGRFRLGLDMFEAEICVLALRIGARQRRSRLVIGLVQAPRGSHCRTQLLHRLENHIRRARRRDNEQAMKQEFVRHLSAYREQLRNELFPRNIKIPNSRRRMLKRAVNRFTVLAVEGLSAAGVFDPVVKDVRKIIQRCLRYRRRGREYFGLRDLAGHDDLARAYLSSLVLATWAKKERRETFKPQKGSPDQTHSP